LGQRAVYATIHAVETFVDRHYAAQIQLIDDHLQHLKNQAIVTKLDAELMTDLQSLRNLLEECRLDEVAHRDDAASRWDGQASWLLKMWRGMVGRGSEIAVSICRHV
jgi:ubiquinone biosynthesis monooxygenase Coq7